MKKLIALFLVSVLLLCSGCAAGAIPAPPALPGAAEAKTSESAAAPESLPATDEPAAPTTSEPAPAAPTETVPATEPAPATSTVPPATEPPVDPWSLLGELSFEQGSYQDKYGNDWTYSYELPCLNAYSADARHINADIDHVFGEQIRSSLEFIDGAEPIGLLDVGFRGAVWEDILSIIVIAHTDWSFDDYRVYCYDCSNDRWLDTRALLERMEIPEQDFLQGCRTLFTDAYKEQYAMIPEESRTDYGYYDGLERADDDKYVNLDLMVYPDNDGTLKVIAPIVSLAGADYYFQELPLKLGEN